MKPEPRSRSLESNDKMWAMLTDISRQLQWPVDGQMAWLDKEDWKVILSAGLKRSQRIAAGIEGGFVVLGLSTRKMKVAEMAALIELIQFFGDSKGVRWSASEAECVP